MKKKRIVLALLSLVPALLQAAIGCTLSNPARDLKTIYPEMTSYREDVKELTRMEQGREWYEALKVRVGGDLDPVYEAFDTPYTLYSVFKGEEKLGYVHGVNVPGRGGVIQLFISAHPTNALITGLFFQRLESPDAAHLRKKAVREQFKGFSLADFYKHDYFAAVEPGHSSDKVAQLKPPEELSKEALSDWTTILRGIRKNLILLDYFVFDRRHEVFYQRAVEARQKKEVNHEKK